MNYNFKYYTAIIIAFLLITKAYAQQKFTDIPRYTGYTNGEDVIEIGNHYFFYVSSVKDSLGTKTNIGYIRKTDFNGNTVDSMILFDKVQSDTAFLWHMSKEANQLVFYGTRAKPDTAYFYSDINFERVRIDTNLNALDTTSVIINTNLQLYGNYLAKRINDRVYFALNINVPTNYMFNSRIFVFDTLMQPLFQKNLLGTNHLYLQNLISTNGMNLIGSFIGAAPPNYNIASIEARFDQNLDTLSTGFKPGYDAYFSGLYPYSSDRYLSVGIKAGFPTAFVDSLTISLIDTNFNIIKEVPMPRHSVLSSFNNIPTFNNHWATSNNKNSIYLGTNWGGYNNSYFTVTNLDSNLNIRWSNVFGGNYPYRINRYYGTSDGGCLLVGSRRLGQSTSDTIEAIVFKVDSMGLVTNVISFEPNINHLFKLYPNPASHIINIKNESKSQYELMIWDVQGKLVNYNKQITKQDYRLDISEYVQGVYFYKIFTEDNKTAHGKFIKK